MHSSAKNYAKLFFNIYCKNSKKKIIVDIGSQDVNGSLKNIVPVDAKYIGVDFNEGFNVDVILTDPYKIPFDNESIDYVICSSVFEHSDFFWLLYLEIMRILKPSGIFYLNVPSNGYIHRYPSDNWRFYPDAGLSLEAWGKKNDFNNLLLESFIGNKFNSSEEGAWNDFVAVFIKDSSNVDQYPVRIIDHHDSYSNAYCFKDQKLEKIKINFCPEDFYDLKERDQKIIAFNEMVKERDQKILDIYNSKSWLITKPFRYFGSLFSANKNIFFKILRKTNEKIHLYSKSYRKKEIILVSDEKPIEVDPQRNLVLEKYLSPTSVSDSSKIFDPEIFNAELNEPSPKKIGARVIAFYLPQFHPIAENDKWWGKGFTEWTNVTKATPQFEDHYQPHLPGELGFYDLRVPDTLLRQVELSKLYGIEGFCFYYYWFSGKVVLDLPLKQIISSNIEAPFCLCWANENWTRRWDGLDNEILIKQEYKKNDAIDFIKSIEIYLKDSRYIKINNKPLLIIYKPLEIPNLSEVLTTWRDYCKNQNIGEIFLCMIRLDNINPEDYGFDAAIEFPPHLVGKGIPSINEHLAIKNYKYKGNIVNYDEFVKRGIKQPPVNFNLFRGVFPSWDNEARRPGAGYTIHNSRPSKFLLWLKSAIRFAKNNPVCKESIVFINAWNEWAEGAHLEPDRLNGYSYLQAIRESLIFPENKITIYKEILIVIHAYYLDILVDILNSISKLSIPYKIIITCSREGENSIKQIIQNLKLKADVRVFDNVGRDIFPFIKIMEELSNQDLLILKLHTKKSPHRVDGIDWGRDLIDKLTSDVNIKRIVEAFNKNYDLGMVGPYGHIISISEYIGANQATLKKLAKQINTEMYPHLATFSAGSMFFIRSKALNALNKISLDASDFEQEAGQIDGTLAHAIERLFGAIIWSEGYFISSTEDPEQIAFNPKNYDYAKSV